MHLTREQLEAELEFHQLAVAWCFKRRRKACDWPQERLAEEAHLSRGEVQHAEHARHGLRDLTRLCLCLALGISEGEFVTEVDRVKGEWAANGLPSDLEMPKTLAVKLAALCDQFRTATTPPPCPSAMTPALLYAWIRA